VKQVQLKKAQQASAAILFFFRCALSVPLGKNPIVIKTPQHAAETLYFLEKNVLWQAVCRY
jgi:hypothetical protein